MKCPKCTAQYDIYNAMIADNGENEGMWICPDCKIILDETDLLPGLHGEGDNLKEEENVCN